MPLRTAKVGQTVTYRSSTGKTADAVVLAKQDAAPPAPGSSTATTGGTLADGSYTYRVSAVINGIETATSAQKTQATTGGGTSTVTINWTAIAATTPYSGASAFKVYGRSGTELLMGTVNMPTTTFVDTGSVTPSGAQPTATGVIRLKLIHLKQLITAGIKATALKQNSRYYKR